MTTFSLDRVTEKQYMQSQHPLSEKKKKIYIYIYFGVWGWSPGTLQTINKFWTA